MRFAKPTLALAALLPAATALRTEPATLVVDAKAKGDEKAGREALELAGGRVEDAKALTAPEDVDAALLDEADAFKDQSCCSKWCCKNNRYSRERVLADLTLIKTEKQ